ncbi:hypothetical protein CEE37_06610 [candidate division LCP-89 bacterium B3_LCP]|uniref:DNA alkylation repair protein n=1 Tax=candidate division LCP-89 bacterium B3_LCP TaxID=2012998 RepID=A0A532V0B0_UNCL8|nr:MAG: hypothetical protein CEE37_06610 [candidate division LCP-89 bacterium B3_LCP]
MNPDEILKQLEPLADEEYRESIDHFTPQTPTEEGGRWTSVGVRVPVLREFEKSLFKQLKTSEDYEMLVAFTDEAYKRRIRELAALGFGGLCRLKKYWRKDLLDYIHEWVPLLSDWGMTDITGGLLCYMILQDIITIDDLVEYRDYPSVWGRRLLIVATVLPLRKGVGDVDRYLEIISWYRNSREKMIVKAISWALREGSKSNPDKIREFIERHSEELHSSILREVRNKLDKGLKNPKR